MQIERLGRWDYSVCILKVSDTLRKGKRFPRDSWLHQKDLSFLVLWYGTKRLVVVVVEIQTMDDL